MGQSVVLEMTRGVASLEIRRPESLNALNGEVLRELSDAVKVLRASSDVSVVVLRSAGEKAFVAGADIKEMASLSPDEARRFSELGSRTFQALSELPQIVIARVQGFALGGGLELALSADFIVASSKARFGLPEVSLGIIPGFGGTQLLSRRIGVARALEWITTAEKYGAEEALAAGVVNRVVPPEELERVLNGIVEAILRNGPGAVQAAKRLARRSSGLSLADGCIMESAEFGLRFGLPESGEGMSAFVEKRTPQFRG
jgi:enoyl-CoA hydratase